MTSDINRDNLYYGRGKHSSGNGYNLKSENHYKDFYGEDHNLKDTKDFFELSPAGFVTINRKCLIKDVNEAFLQMLDSSEDNLLDCNLTEVIPKPHKEIFQSFLDDIIYKKGQMFCDIDLIRDDESLIHCRLFGNMQNTGSDTVCLVVNDISDHVNNEIRLKQLLSELSRANEIINNQNFELRELNAKLTVNTNRLNKALEERDEFINSISGDLTKVFGRFLVLAEYVNREEAFKKNPEVMEMTRDLYGAVKSTMKLLDQYHRL